MSQSNQCKEGLHLFSSCGGGDYWYKKKYIHALIIWKSFGVASAHTSTLLAPAFSSSKSTTPIPITSVLATTRISFPRSTTLVVHQTS
jgi:hypothetical protein